MVKFAIHLESDEANEMWLWLVTRDGTVVLGEGGADSGPDALSIARVCIEHHLQFASR